VACREETCALRAPTTFLALKRSIRAKSAVLIENQIAVRVVLSKDRRLRADVFFIRTQSAIRADGCRPRKPQHALRREVNRLHQAVVSLRHYPSACPKPARCARQPRFLHG
jgi:hypothetical protein